MLEFLEAIVDFDALLLREITVHGLGRESLLVEDLSELNRMGYRLHEDDNLVEIKSVDEVSKLCVLLVLVKLDIVLLESMESEFALVFNQDLSGVLHELSASGLDVSRESSGEHHNLLVVRGLFEDSLDVTAHVHLVEKSVAFIKYEHLKVSEREVLLTDKLKDTAGSSHNDVRRLKSLEKLDVILDGLTTVNYISADVLHVLCESDELVLDLVSELAGVTEDDGTAGLGIFSQVLENSEDEDGSLSHTGDSLAKYIDSKNGLGDAFLLDIRGMLETAVDNRALYLRLEEHVLETCRVNTNVGATRFLCTSHLLLLGIISFESFAF